MAFFSVFIFIIITLITTIFAFLKHQQSYWKRRGIPHDPPSFPQGNLYPATKHMRDITRENYQKYKNVGPFGGFYFFLNPAVIVYDLDLARDIFIKDFSNFTSRGLFHNEKDDPLTGNLLSLEGAKWKYMRNKLSPTFTSGKMKFMFPTVVMVAQRLVDTLGAAIEKNTILEIKDIVARFTVDVIGTCGFGIECNSLKNPEAEFREMGEKSLSLKRHNFIVSLFMFSFPDLAQKLRMKQTHDDVEKLKVSHKFDKVRYKSSYVIIFPLETLRKYPVITNLVRRSINEYPTSNPKFIIPKNSMVLIPTDAIHHDPEIYPDPEKFDPERFSPEEVQKRHSCSWLPFGEGPRHCIGLRFGKMQTSIGLAMLIKNYKFSPCEKTPSVLEMNPANIVLTSKGGIYLRVERI
ncbi:LOW QUALITY PROTEIN: cytochrome P450 6a2-like [Eupeodes corollae]|uniref:LOW QUALITY PROTEIN: cytochrome P450 6a2-like n=1 Tax=Eupeodes corollae TaxID=290404 RepID=UPI002491EA5A|nr:LOW QUALITY PROTEIN: cytochrome P450 6a2-like [Eupeodes corollae]